MNWAGISFDITDSKIRARFAVLLASALFFTFGPSVAMAQTSVRTVELLPPGQNTCATLTVSDVEPHVYGGLLESYDITIADNSYVSVLGTVGNTSIPLGYMTRWAATSGVRIHVDIPTTVVGSGVPVTLTLLPASGEPVCMSVISFEVSAAGNAYPTTVSTYTATPISQSSQSVSSSNSSMTAGQGTSQQINSTTNTASSQPSSTSTMQSGTSATATSIAVGTSITGPGSICAGNNAYRLWFILLVIYLIIVAVVVFAEPWFLEQSVLGSTGAILVPLILLLAFWYFSESCRAASWIPVVACVIAVIGLFLAFREYETIPESVPPQI